MRGPFTRQAFTRGYGHVILERSLAYFTETMFVSFSETLRHNIFRARFYMTKTRMTFIREWLSLTKVIEFFTRPVYFMYRVPAFIVLTFFLGKIVAGIYRKVNLLLPIYARRMTLFVRAILDAPFWIAVRGTMKKYCNIFARIKR